MTIVTVWHSNITKFYYSLYDFLDIIAATSIPTFTDSRIKASTQYIHMC